MRFPPTIHPFCTLAILKTAYCRDVDERAKVGTKHSEFTYGSLCHDEAGCELKYYPLERLQLITHSAYYGVHFQCRVIKGFQVRGPPK